MYPSSDLYDEEQTAAMNIYLNPIVENGVAIVKLQGLNTKSYIVAY